MSHVTSNDGTRIAYERLGRGPAVILVGGGATDRSENAPLAVELERHFTVYNYDRRGRGASGDTLPYALEREIEDLAALLMEAGGSAHGFGVSSGGSLLLEAAAAGLAFDAIAVYEVPYDWSEGAPQRHRAYVEKLEALLAEGRRGDAFAHFMRLAGSSEKDIHGARRSRMWPDLEALAHTLVYDAACYGDPSPARLATIARPTLVLTGDAGGDFFSRAAEGIAKSVPHATRRLLDGQTHVADPKVLASTLEQFFTARGELQQTR